MFLCAHIYSSAYREVRRLYLILPNCSYREISPDNPDFYVDAASVGAGVWDLLTKIHPKWQKSLPKI